MIREKYLLDSKFISKDHQENKLDFELYRNILENAVAVPLNELTQKHYGYMYPVHFVTVFRSAQSNRTLLTIEDRRYKFAHVHSEIPMPSAGAPLSDYILMGARLTLEKVFLKVIPHTILKARPLTLGAIKHDGILYLITYLFIDDSLFHVSELKENVIMCRVFSVDAPAGKTYITDAKYSVDVHGLYSHIDHVLLHNFVEAEEGNNG